MRVELGDEDKVSRARLLLETGERAGNSIAMNRPGLCKGGRILAIGLALAVLFPVSSSLFGFGHSSEHQQVQLSGSTFSYDKVLAYDNDAIQADPSNVENYFNRGMLHMMKGNHDKSSAEYDLAIADFSQGIQLDPKNAKAYIYRATVHGTKAENEKSDAEYKFAIADFTSALNLDAQSAEAYYGRGSTYAAIAQYDKALADYAQAIQYGPDQTMAYNNFAWLLATCPQAKLRDGKKAVEYATKSCQLSEWKEGASLDTLAAAYAEAGDFDNAVKWENASMQIPNQTPSVIADDQSRLALYQAHKAYHEPK